MCKLKLLGCGLSSCKNSKEMDFSKLGGLVMPSVSIGSAGVSFMIEIMFHLGHSEVKDEAVQ